jgi:hypothetical protein
VVAINHLLRGDAFLIGPDGDGGAVGVAARDHQDFVALKAVIAGKDVGAQVAAGDMTKVKWAVGVGPGHSHKNTFRNTFSNTLRYTFRQG